MLIKGHFCSTQLLHAGFVTREYIVLNTLHSMRFTCSVGRVCVCLELTFVLSLCWESQRQDVERSGTRLWREALSSSETGRVRLPHSPSSNCCREGKRGNGGWRTTVGSATFDEHMCTLASCSLRCDTRCACELWSSEK